MKAVLLVAIGCALGSLTRYALTFVTSDSAAATLNANLIGVALAGYLLVLMERRGTQSVRWFLLPGFCAGMTTFSAITIEVVGENAKGFGYLVLTAVASLITIVVAIAYGRATIKVKP